MIAAQKLLCALQDEELRHYTIIGLTGVIRAHTDRGRVVPESVMVYLEALKDSAAIGGQSGDRLSSHGDNESVNPSAYLTLPEAAEVLHLSPRTLRRRVATGELRTVSVGPRRKLVPIGAILEMLAA